MELRGKAALVTGGASGIGASTSSLNVAGSGSSGALVPVTAS